MNSNEENDKIKKNKSILINTFSIPFDLKEIINNVDINTDINLNYSKKEIIDQAIKFHIEGNINDAKRYYIHCLKNGFNDPIVFSNYGIILRDCGKLFEAERYTRQAILIKPNFADAYLNLGNILNDLGKVEEGEKYIRKAIKFKPNYINAYLNLGDILSTNGKSNQAEALIRKAIEFGSNYKLFLSLGNILRKLEKFEEAEKYIRKAIEMNPNDAISYNDLGLILKDLNKFEEARLMILRAIDIDPQNSIFNNNLGATLKDIGNLDDAEKYTRNAIELNPNFAEAFLCLGNIKNDLGNSMEAEVYTRKAIELKPDYVIAYNNLASILNDIGSLEEAEKYISQAIKINPNLAISYLNLSIILYKKNQFNTSMKNIRKALNLDPKSKDIQLIFHILNSKSLKDNDRLSVVSKSGLNQKSIPSSPVILYRDVEKELINSLYKIKSLDLNKFNDPTFGNARGSDYKLFEENFEITNKLKDDLLNISKDFTKTEVFFRDSFFTILEGESIIKKHNHIVDIDNKNGLNIYKQKYSLVYYLLVGDQKSTHPGILKFYDPNEEILPDKGMIIIFPADRYHSVFYNGRKDRLIVGVNFYSL